MIFVQLIDLVQSILWLLLLVRVILIIKVSILFVKVRLHLGLNVGQVLLDSVGSISPRLNPVLVIHELIVSDRVCEQRRDRKVIDGELISTEVLRVLFF